MYLLGIDIGTSSTKSAVFDRKGNIVSLASKGYTFEAAKPGYAEQDPEDWWDAVKQSIRRALEQGNLTGEEIEAVGLSGQMHGVVPLDKDGKVIRKAILHCDVRASEEVEEIKGLFGESYEKTVYNPVFPGFQAVSLYWMKKHEPEQFERIAWAICPKDYIRYRLTGELGTEHTDASGTLLYDMENCGWARELFLGLGVDPGIVPGRIANSFDVAGTVCREAARGTGLSERTKVVYGGADQAMQSTGNGVYEPGTLMATIGTSGQVLTVSRQPVFNSELNTHTFRHVEKNSWYALGATLFAGSTLNWFQRTFCENLSFEQLSGMAQQVPACSDGLVFFPCMGGERTPYLDPKTKGMFSGISMVHGKAHFARAIMEGVSFSIKESLDTVQRLYGGKDRLICAGGGVKGDTWAQIQADVYGREILVSRVKEQACLGAAIVAGIGAGAFGSLAEACQAMCDSSMKPVAPIAENVKRYQEFYEKVYRKLYACNAGLFHEIDRFTNG